MKSNLRPAVLSEPLSPGAGMDRQNLVPNGPLRPAALDLAGEQYWQRNWTRINFRHPINPRDPALSNYVNRAFHQWFASAFRDLDTTGLRLLEVGCGSSEWLPYLAKEFGFQVSGLDYSERGCALAAEILSAERIAGRVFQADLFSPPKELLGSFDVVVSFGVVEHFSPTEDCLRALRRYLRPAGRLISIVPNLSGLMGILQYLLDREVREKHLIMDRESLVVAHEKASLRPLSCEYPIFLNLGVLNAECWKEHALLYWLTERVRSVGSKLAWLGESHIGVLKPNCWTSPYIFCLAERDR